MTHTITLSLLQCLQDSYVLGTVPENIHTDTLAVIDAVRRLRAHTQHSLLLALDPDNLVVTGSNRLIHLGIALYEWAVRLYILFTQ